MAVLNPNDLFDQADRLLVPPRAGPPRQVDIRRAISAAYYGLFHFTAASLADEVVGVTLRATNRYALVYRSLDHRTLRDICSELLKKTPAPRFRPYFPPNGLEEHIRDFATTAIDLQQWRHRADYDPTPRLRTSEANLAIASARSAVARFASAGQDHRKAFLTLLLCPPR